MTEFLNYLSLSLARGLLPKHLEFSDPKKIKHMFENRKMKNDYRKYLIESFNKHQQKIFILKPLAEKESEFLRMKMKGPVEYFYFIDTRKNKLTIFLIGPYGKPVQTVLEKDYKKQ